MPCFLIKWSRVQPRDALEGWADVGKGIFLVFVDPEHLGNIPCNLLETLMAFLEVDLQRFLFRQVVPLVDDVGFFVDIHMRGRKKAMQSLPVVMDHRYLPVFKQSKGFKS